MMYNILKPTLLLIILVSCISCNDNTKDNSLTNEQLIKQAEILYHNDQKWRRTLSALETATCIEIDETIFSSKTKKGRLANRLLFQDIINEQDSINTEKLIKLTNDNGFPGMDRLNHKYPVCLIFVHSDKKFFPEIIELVEREYQKGNMNVWEKDRILWHVDRGRNGFWQEADKPIWYGKDEDILEYFLE